MGGGGEGTGRGGNFIVPSDRTPQALSRITSFQVSTRSVALVSRGRWAWEDDARTRASCIVSDDRSDAEERFRCTNS